MFAWLSANIGTIIVAVILIAVVVSIIVSQIRNRKNGKTSCSCGCQNCAMAAECHKQH